MYDEERDGNVRQHKNKPNENAHVKKEERCARVQRK